MQYFDTEEYQKYMEQKHQEQYSENIWCGSAIYTHWV